MPPSLARSGFRDQGSVTNFLGSPSEAPELRETETGLRQGPVLTAPPSVSTLGQAECSLPAARSLGAPRGGASEEGPVLRREGTSAGVLLLLCACLN
uniref:Uncharacterized protein n=1 Tax=Rangifer tarandus platyrhynchus TaxID=3082113 RepID=A0ACB0ELU2_RANTA|nr:unnamed protein product [Rangifer tarandus platyrhynchus]